MGFVCCDKNQMEFNDATMQKSMQRPSEMSENEKSDKPKIICVCVSEMKA